MVEPCIECGELTGLVDSDDFYFRCKKHVHHNVLADLAEVDIPLNSRELQVCLFAADGYTNNEIGEELNLSNQYIRNIVSRSLAKLGVRNRRAFNRRLRQYGL